MACIWFSATMISRMLYKHIQYDAHEVAYLTREHIVVKVSRVHRRV